MPCPPVPPLLTLICIAGRKKGKKWKKRKSFKAEPIKSFLPVSRVLACYRLRMVIGCKFQLTITTKINCFNTTLKLFEIWD